MQNYSSRVPTNKPRKISMIISLQNKIWNFPDRSTVLPKFIYIFIYDKEGKLAGPTQILPVNVRSPALILKTGLFNDISRQKFPNFHDNSERHKTENHRTTCYAWPPYTPYVHYWVLLRKSVKVFLFHLMNSISVNNTCKIHIYLPRLSVKTTSISEFNDFSMSDWSKIQWIFHDFVILTNFKNFSWNSMIFQWSWNRSEFQWFFKSCGNPVIIYYLLDLNITEYDSNNIYLNSMYRRQKA